MTDEIAYCEKFISDLESFEIRLSDNTNAVAIKTTVGMWNRDKKRYDTADFTNSMAFHIGNAISLFRKDKRGNAANLLEWIDKARAANLIIPTGLNGKLKTLREENDRLQETVKSLDKTIKSLNDELHDKDAEKRRLEDLLSKNDINFGSERGDVS